MNRGVISCQKFLMGSYWGTGFPLGKGLADFLNPITWREMNRVDDVFAWERYSSNMDETDGFGNIFED